MKNQRKVFQSLTLILQFGLNMIVPIVMCTLLGAWLGKKYGMPIITVPLFIMGALAGFNNIFKMAKQIWKDMCSPLPPWLPIWFPINLISEIAVPISLSLRMFANVLSGTVMMALVYGLLGKIAIIWPAALHVYFDLFSGAIQTYVFCMLTMTYISQNYETE